MDLSLVSSLTYLGMNLPFANPVFMRRAVARQFLRYARGSVLNPLATKSTLMCGDPRPLKLLVDVVISSHSLMIAPEILIFTFCARNPIPSALINLLKPGRRFITMRPSKFYIQIEVVSTYRSNSLTTSPRLVPNKNSPCMTLPRRMALPNDLMGCFWSACVLCFMQVGFPSLCGVRLHVMSFG